MYNLGLVLAWRHTNFYKIPIFGLVVINDQGEPAASVLWTSENQTKMGWILKVKDLNLEQNWMGPEINQWKIKKNTSYFATYIPKKADFI
jgi:hypothetical protein